MLGLMRKDEVDKRLRHLVPIPAYEKTYSFHHQRYRGR